MVQCPLRARLDGVWPGSFFASSPRRSGHSPLREPDALFSSPVIFSAIVPNWPALGTATLDDAEARVARVERIFEQHLDAVWRTARDLGVFPRDLEDVVQEVMIVCVRRLGDIEPGRERPFLLGATARVVSNWRRSRRRRPAEPVESVEGLGVLEGGAALSPAEALEHKRELQLVQTALEQMNDLQRVAFTLFEIEGLSAREIAEQLGLSEQVVFSRVQRARAMFHRFVARLRGVGAAPVSELER